MHGKPGGILPRHGGLRFHDLRDDDPGAPPSALRLATTLEEIESGAMTAYVISDVVGRDPRLVAQYRELARSSIAHHGGWYLANVGAAIDHVEGDWQPANIVIVAFPTMDRAREWYRSSEYAAALDVRQDALSRSLIFVAGADEE